MATIITDSLMSSDQTRHTARVNPDGAWWSVTWLPGRALTRDQAISAMTIAESVDAALDPYSTERVWPHITGWAAELGLCDIDAVAMASLPPEFYAYVPRDGE
jgi:hypothetical protein